MVTHRTTLSGSPGPAVRESLEGIASRYRHLAAEHRREGAHGSWRRRFEGELSALERRFEDLLEQWIPDEGERRKWRGHLAGVVPLPERVATRGMLRFAGRSETGATLEVRESESGQDVWRDGALMARLSEETGLDTIEGSARVRIEGTVFDEEFEAPDDAVAALVAFADAARGPAPWRWAEELAADGLIDRHFSLTPRGRRLVDRRRRS